MRIYIYMYIQSIIQMYTYAYIYIYVYTIYNTNVYICVYIYIYVYIYIDAYHAYQWSATRLFDSGGNVGVQVDASPETDPSRALGIPSPWQEAMHDDMRNDKNDNDNMILDTNTNDNDTNDDVV